MIILPDAAGIQKASNALTAGELVAFPTETVYGLGANALEEKAVKKIFALKGRPPTNPLIVHVADLSHLSRYATLPDAKDDRVLVEKLTGFWPGPLSIVLPKKDIIPDVVTAGQPTVAIRVPNHPVALALIRTAGLPLAAPSANRSTTVSPTTAHHVADSFGLDSPLILDGGACAVGLESTVVTVRDGRIVVLRHGGVTVEELEFVTGASVISDIRHVTSDQTPLTSPGMLSKHYAPQTPLIFRESLGEKGPEGSYGLITFSARAIDPLAQGAAALLCLSTEGNEIEIARKLFGALRDIDSRRLDLLIVDSCEEKGLGRAIMDRLRRAQAR